MLQYPRTRPKICWAEILPRQWHSRSRNIASAASSQTTSRNPSGDISSVFPSLANDTSHSRAPSPTPLPPRFAAIKRQILQGNEAAIDASFRRLLSRLAQSTSQIPSISYSDIKHHNIPALSRFSYALRSTGVGILRSVVPESEALSWAVLAKRYIRSNASTTGFPANNPAVWEVYWSPAQVLARAHPDVLAAQSFMMSHWSCPSLDKDGLISTSHPVTYADRLRIRPPGDAGFALGPHVDAGSVERWEPSGYGDTYEAILSGKWEEYDPWYASSARLRAASNLYGSVGSCSVFRMFQGWMAMSAAKPGEGSLIVNTMLKEAMAYVLLRPFFRPVRERQSCASEEMYLHESNWQLIPPDTIEAVFHGATMGSAQELNDTFHPHLHLDRSMTSIPEVKPGDYVFWHCDTVHAVDAVHRGTQESSVLYIPACPLTLSSAEYVRRQRETFATGAPGPDFIDETHNGGGEHDGRGEAEHVGRLSTDFVMGNLAEKGLEAMGLKQLTARGKGMGWEREEAIVRRANEILDFV